jgi:flagellar biogenesis protein FliO
MEKIGMKWLLVCLLFSHYSLLANVQIKNIEYLRSTDGDKVVLHLSDKLQLGPDFKINSYMVQLEFKGVVVWPKIEQKFAWKNNILDSTIMAYQYDKEMVRFRIIFPEKIELIKDLVRVNIAGSSIEVNFPKYSENLFNAVVPVAQSVGSVNKEQGLAQEEKEKKDVGSVVDEVYLNSLLNKNDLKNIKKIEETTKDSINVAPKSTTAFSARPEVVNPKVIQNPSLKKNEISIPWFYFFKYLFFMGVVLGIFYVLVFVIKKGFLARGNLGLLSNSSVVTVLSNNYIAPKRSLMTVKVHEQVFLLSNCESGVSFLAEIKGPTSVLKNGERLLTGQNFDTNMANSDNNEKIDQSIKIKEDIHSSDNGPIKSEGRFKFAEQIKKKVKSLRPLQ